MLSLLPSPTKPRPAGVWSLKICRKRASPQPAGEGLGVGVGVGGHFSCNNNDPLPNPPPQGGGGPTAGPAGSPAYAFNTPRMRLQPFEGGTPPAGSCRGAPFG